MVKKENEFQANLKKRIKKALPGVTILKNNPNDILGIPDLTILGVNGRYAILECKREKNAVKQALQDYYIDKFDKQSYASFVDPSNEDQVIEDLKRVLQNHPNSANWKIE